MSSISIRPQALSGDEGKGEQGREEKKISLNNYDKKKWRIPGCIFRDCTITNQSCLLSLG